MRTRKSQQPVVINNSGNYVGDINASGSANVRVTQQIIKQESPALDALFKQAHAAARARPQKVQTKLKQIEKEASKGGSADQAKLENWFSGLAKMAPDIVDVMLASLGGPVSGFTAVFKKIAQKAKDTQTAANAGIAK
jgi:hypothetical protein